MSFISHMCLMICLTKKHSCRLFPILATPALFVLLGSLSLLLPHRFLYDSCISQEFYRAATGRLGRNFLQIINLNHNLETRFNEILLH